MPRLSAETLSLPMDNIFQPDSNTLLTKNRNLTKLLFLKADQPNIYDPFESKGRVVSSAISDTPASMPAAPNAVPVAPVAVPAAADEYIISVI